MKRLLLTLIASIACIWSFSQTTAPKLHSFDGDFTFNEFVGKAHYNYLDAEDGTRIFTGPFSFTGNMSEKLFLNVQGEFKDDFKNGIWTYNSTLKRGLVTSLKQTLTANYKSGVVSGPLKVYANTTIHTKDENYTIIISGSAQTSNNCFSGEIAYNRKIIGRTDFFKPLTLKGQFNGAGFCDGIWKITYQSDNLKMYQATITFINGVMISVKDIDLQTGESVGSYDHPELIEDAKQLTVFQSQSTVDGVTKTWKFTSAQLSNMIEVQNLFSDPLMHLNPKGHYGVLPEFKTRVLQQNY